MLVISSLFWIAIHAIFGLSDYRMRFQFTGIYMYKRFIYSSYFEVI